MGKKGSSIYSYKAGLVAKAVARDIEKVMKDA